MTSTSDAQNPMPTMEETLINIFTHPLVIGLCIGLVVAMVIWLRSLGKLRVERSATAAQADRLQDQIETLKRHLHTQMGSTERLTD